MKTNAYHLAFSSLLPICLVAYILSESLMTGVIANVSIEFESIIIHSSSESSDSAHVKVPLPEFDSPSPSASASSSSSVSAVDPSFPYDNTTSQQLFTFASAAYCNNSGEGLFNFTCLPCQQLTPNYPPNVPSSSVVQVVRMMMNETTDNFGFVAVTNLSTFNSLPLPLNSLFVDDNDETPPDTRPVIILSFRGTVENSTANQDQDLNTTLIQPFPNADFQVHAGFWSAYQALKEQTLKGIQEAIDLTDSNIVIAAGHSLGAAMATMALMDLSLNYYQQFKYALYTVGSPRAGNADFSKQISQLASASFRVVHYADPVPHLPSIYNMYQQVPYEIWYNETFDGYTVCNATNSGEQANCSNSLNWWDYNVTDHLYYFQTLVGACSKSKEGDLRSSVQASYFTKLSGTVLQGVGKSKASGPHGRGSVVDSNFASSTDEAADISSCRVTSDKLDVKRNSQSQRHSCTEPKDEMAEVDN